MVTKRIRCEAFPCRELAAFSIGPEGRRLASYNYCRKDFETIVKEGAELLGYRLVSAEDEEQAEVTMLEPEKIEPMTELSDDEKTVDEQTLEEEEKEATTEHQDFTDTTEQAEPTALVTTSKEEVTAEVAQEVYTCRHCGMTFPKTKEGKIELMKHSKICPKKPPKK